MKTMSRFSAEERSRRRQAEAGFWKEMEELGISRLDAFLDDEKYERLNEIRRGLITTEDKRRSNKRAMAFMANVMGELEKAQKVLWEIGDEEDDQL
jgi:hypothetical protein